MNSKLSYLLCFLSATLATAVLSPQEACAETEMVCDDLEAVIHDFAAALVTHPGNQQIYDYYEDEMDRIAVCEGGTTTMFTCDPAINGCSCGDTWSCGLLSSFCTYPAVWFNGVCYVE